MIAAPPSSVDPRSDGRCTAVPTPPPSQTAIANTLPTFLVLGAGKSGTTSVWHALTDHPEVFVTSIKETNFFALRGESGGEATTEERIDHYPNSITTETDYRRLFDDASATRPRGEVCPMYLYDEQAPDNIHALLGTDVRLVAILRQPADRLFSRWQHLVAEGYPPSDRFTDALDRSSVWWRRPDLVREGFYATHLQRYLDRFPHRQIRVFLFEDLIDRPLATIQNLFHFIGADPTYRPTMGAYNSSKRVEHRLVEPLLGRNGSVKKALLEHAPSWMERVRTSTPVQWMVNSIRQAIGTRDALSPSLRATITREIYRDEIDQLETLLDRSLDAWRPSSPAPTD